MFRFDPASNHSAAEASRNQSTSGRAVRHWARGFVERGAWIPSSPARPGSPPPVIEPDVVMIPLSRAGWIHLVWPGGEH